MKEKPVQISETKKKLHPRLKRLIISFIFSVVIGLGLIIWEQLHRRIEQIFLGIEWIPLAGIYMFPELLGSLLFGAITRQDIIQRFLSILIFYIPLSFLYLSLIRLIKNRTIKRVISIIIPLLLFITGVGVSYWALSQLT